MSDLGVHSGPQTRALVPNHLPARPQSPGHEMNGLGQSPKELPRSNTQGLLFPYNSLIFIFNSMLTILFHHWLYHPIHNFGKGRDLLSLLSTGPQQALHTGRRNSKLVGRIPDWKTGLAPSGADVPTLLLCSRCSSLGKLFSSTSSVLVEFSSSLLARSYMEHGMV